MRGNLIGCLLLCLNFCLVILFAILYTSLIKVFYGKEEIPTGLLDYCNYSKLLNLFHLISELTMCIIYPVNEYTIPTIYEYLGILRFTLPIDYQQRRIGQRK